MGYSLDIIFCLKNKSMTKIGKFRSLDASSRQLIWLPLINHLCGQKLFEHEHFSKLNK